MLKVEVIIYGLIWALLQTVVLYFLLRATTNFLTRPGVGRLLLFHFMVCIPLGIAGVNFAKLAWNREQGVELTYPISTWVTANVAVLLISYAMSILQDSLLCVCSIAISVYMYNVIEFRTRGQNAEYYPLATGVYVLVTLFFFLCSAPFLDTMYAAFDDAMGGNWYGETPADFLSTWREGKPMPPGGISMGFGWASNYHVENTPTNLWDGGYFVFLTAALLSMVIPLAFEWRRDDLLLRTSDDYRRLLDPKKNGFENLARFFGAIQMESAGVEGSIMGISNNKAIDEFVHGAGGTTFVKNVSELTRDQRKRYLVRGRVKEEPGPGFVKSNNGSVLPEAFF